MSETFGHKVCDVPGYEHVWCQFATSGYPRKLRREWDAADSDEIQRIFLRYITAWHLTDVAGAVVENTREPACLDNVEDAVVVWLLRAFTLFWLKELTAPRPNSLLPSPAT
jgi:hypothetical protein